MCLQAVGDGLYLTQGLVRWLDSHGALLGPPEVTIFGWMTGRDGRNEDHCQGMLHVFYFG